MHSTAGQASELSRFELATLTFADWVLICSVSLDNCNVPLPVVESLSPEGALLPGQEASLWSFVGMCRLTLVLESVFNLHYRRGRVLINLLFYL